MDPHFSFPQFVAPAALPFQDAMQAAPAAHAHTYAVIARVSKRVREEELSQADSSKRLRTGRSDSMRFRAIEMMIEGNFPEAIQRNYYVMPEQARGQCLIEMATPPLVELLHIEWILDSGPISRADFSTALRYSLETSGQMDKPSVFHLLHEACPEILRNFFSAEDRGNFLLAALDVPFDNASVIQTIKQSGLISKEHQTEALWKAAKAETPKPECLKVLNWGSQIEEVEEETKEDGIRHYSNVPQSSKRVKHSHSNSVNRVNMQATLLWQLVSPMLAPKTYALSALSINP